MKMFFKFRQSLIVLYVLTQGIRQVIQPKIVGDSMGLPPLATLFFLYLGFKFRGIAGMIIAVPVGILFIRFYGYGAFVGLDKIIADRVGNKGVGFNSEIAGPTSVDENDLLRQVLPQDLNAFGMIPEFVGRTPVVTQTQALDEDDLVSILTEPKNAVVRQYRKMFQLEDVELEFEDAALHEIARMALARKTGARGLRSICEDVLQQTMFDLPSEEGVTKVIVTEASVKGEEQPQRIYG